MQLSLSSWFHDISEMASREILLKKKDMAMHAFSRIKVEFSSKLDCTISWTLFLSESHLFFKGVSSKTINGFKFQEKEKKSDAYFACVLEKNGNQRA